MFSTKTVQAHNLFGTPVAPSAAAGCLPRPGVRSHRRYLVRSQNETDAVPKPQDAPANQAKVNSTLSTLDSLLGTEQKEAEMKANANPPSSAAAPQQQSGSFSAWPTVPKPQQPPQRKEAPKKGSFTFDQVMGFEGIAPEVINSRAAMLGFMCAIKAETATGESVFAQLLTGGFWQAAAVILAVTIASFAPAIARGVPMDECFNKDPKKEKSVGPFNANAEIRNGRAAMVGIALILLLEGGSGTAFFI
uniref:Uncharacterized protein n=1 Tax=Dunaliella tertiolecta TaxID=3047 RepID=A0A7S3VKI7_DUNTE|mmetsp:Transcript_6787/g.18223  ORF Transcript_6787/g.18223 Transcript_6787/m.18223 type:complete len:248 (+) Transcript_6787:44-787(+)|eukprot:CAMPEP_0202342528 /NCGR_PEP_ID=MMETSP1126-20121109/3055_1 /ASSEMBLY_ACC=CAM_ASM_000457 /TAXON_ID=3047 /ORGANISM="Dunaliella tertiolecta, Strain CCMP1320" /LENGTH=247 /DNA_ID=CAMNT_0048933499 /DNA_START=39 /DNA_END=782 /DNA_ORIENTATION=+